jgi:hypothetical protein
VKYGSPTVPVPGYDVRVLDDAGTPVPRGHAGRDRDQAAAAAGLPADAVERRRALRRRYLADFPGYYKTADAGYHRRRRLRLRDGAHRRHHQRRGPPPLDGQMEEVLAGTPTSPSAR